MNDCGNQMHLPSALQVDGLSCTCGHVSMIVGNIFTYDSARCSDLRRSQRNLPIIQRLIPVSMQFVHLFDDVKTLCQPMLAQEPEGD